MKKGSTVHAILIALLLAALGLTHADVALAHPVAQGSGTLRIFGDRVELQLRASTEEVLTEAMLTGDPPGAGAGDPWTAHGAYLLKHIRIALGAHELTGTVHAITAPGAPLPGGATNAGDAAIYDLVFASPGAASSGTLTISQDVLNEFDFAPGNRWEATYLLAIGETGGPLQGGRLLTSREELRYDYDLKRVADGAKGAADEVLIDHYRLSREYLHHGIMHILTGYDHLLFVSALVLASLTLWDLLVVVSAFTLSHTLTLTLSVLDLVRLPERIVEPMIAASIVFVAMQNVIWPAASRGKTRLAAAFFFGLFHGLGFAGGLLDVMQGLSGWTVGLAILTFSLGVELGHQMVVLPLFAFLRGWRSFGGTEHAVQRIFTSQMRYGSAVISVAGIYYLMAALSL